MNPTPEEEILQTVHEEWRRINAERYDGRLPAEPPPVRVNGARRQLGVCRMRARRGGRREIQDLGFSRYLVKDRRTFLDTIRHEIAHAAAWLLEGEAGHGPRWQAHARQCGARPEATCGRAHERIPELADVRYELHCDGCRQVIARRQRRVGAIRNPRGYKCSLCGSPRLRVVDRHTGHETRPEPREPEMLPRYRVECLDCTRVIARRERATGPAKTPERYRCGACGGARLRVVDLRPPL